jgi:hypothetical protein
VADYHSYFVGEDRIWVHNCLVNANLGGGLKAATSFLESAGASGLKTISTRSGPVLTGTLPGGATFSLRSFAKGSSEISGYVETITIQINSGKSVFKFRF